MAGLGNTSNNRFKIEKSIGAGYSMRIANRSLEINFWQAGNNGTTPWVHNSLPVPQQDWLFYRVAEG